jgi:diacylglycerol kinase (ATP)
MSKISIYYNERASSASQNPWVMGLSNQLFRHNVQIRSPEDYDSLKGALADDVNSGTEFIFSVGGDGTAHTIIQEIVNTPVKFMCIPAGTANDFASELGMTKNVDNVVKIFQRKSVKKVDVIKVNEKYLLSSGGIGIAAEVANKINKYRKKLKGFSYVMSKLGSNIYTTIFAKEMLLRPFKTYRLILESSEFQLSGNEIVAPLVLISNQAKLGGKFHVAPQTVNDDGRYNVAVFLHDNKKDLLLCALRLLNGDTPSDDKNFIQFETSSLKIQSLSGEIPFLADGEILDTSSSFQIEILPKALEVFSHNDDLLACQYYDLDSIEI